MLDRHIEPQLNAVIPAIARRPWRCALAIGARTRPFLGGYRGGQAGFLLLPDVRGRRDPHGSEFFRYLTRTSGIRPSMARPAGACRA